MPHLNAPENDSPLLPDRSGIWLAGATAFTAVFIMWFVIQFDARSSDQAQADTGVVAAAPVEAQPVVAEPTPTPALTAGPTTSTPTPTATPTPSALTPDPTPGPPPGATSVEEVLTIQPVTFQSGVTSVQPLDALPLDAIAAYLIQMRVPVEISGYSDLEGDPDWNRELSQQRADAVREYLIAKGVPANLMTAVGYGAVNPVIEPELSDADSRKNRRVEVRFVPTADTPDTSSNNDTDGDTQ